MKTILLADDHPLVRKGLRSVIEILKIAETILEAGDGLDVIKHAAKNHIDLFLLDFKMPKMNGYDAAKVLLKENPHCKIIIISVYNDKALISNLVKIGVRGFLPKNTGIDEIEAAIRVVLSGDLYFDDIPEETCNELNSCHHQPVKFSVRENELINLLISGKTSREVAESWGLALKTIETYRSRLLVKTQTRNTSELLHYFYKNGLV